MKKKNAKNSVEKIDEEYNEVKKQIEQDIRNINTRDKFSSSPFYVF